MTRIYWFSIRAIILYHGLHHFFRSSLSQNYIGKDFQRFAMFPKGLPVVSNVLSLGSLGYRDGEIKKGNEMQLS